jgi:hypothetical protein
MLTQKEIDDRDAEIANHMVDASPNNNSANEVLTAVEDYIAAGSTELGLTILAERLAYLKQVAFDDIAESKRENKGDVS